MQNGLGKNFRYVLSHHSDKIEILAPLRNNEMVFLYHQAKAGHNRGRIFTQTLTAEQAWPDELDA